MKGDFLKHELPLQAEDRLKLKSTWQKAAIAVAVFELIIMGIFAFLLYHDFGIFAYIFVGLLVLLPTAGLVYFYMELQKDMKQGLKNVIQGILKDKYYRVSKSKNTSATYYYYVQVGEEVISVDKGEYDRVEVGDLLEVHVAQSSQTLLRLEVIAKQHEVKEIVSDRTDTPKEAEDQTMPSPFKKPLDAANRAILKARRLGAMTRIILGNLFMGALGYVIWWIFWMVVIIGFQWVAAGSLAYLLVYYGSYAVIGVFLARMIGSLSKTRQRYQQVFDAGQSLERPARIKEWRHAKHKISPSGITITNAHGDFYYLFLENGGRVQASHEAYEQARQYGWIWLSGSLDGQETYRAYLANGAKLDL